MKQKPLIYVYSGGDRTQPAEVQRFRAGISGSDVLDVLEVHGPGALQDPEGVFVSREDRKLPAGDYHFFPADGPGTPELLFYKSSCPQHMFCTCAMPCNHPL